MPDDDIFNDGTKICALHGMRYDPKLADGCIRCATSMRPGKLSGPPPRSMFPRAGTQPPPASVRNPSTAAPPAIARRSASPQMATPAPPSVRPPLVTSDRPPPVRSTAPPRSVPPASDGSGSSHPSDRPLDSAPPIPYEPGGLLPGIPSQPPIITLMPGPVMQRRNRRKFLAMVGLSLVAGVGGAAWYFDPGARDWLKRVKTFRYGDSAQYTGSFFVPTGAVERACPLLLLLDDAKRGDRLCARYARHCEEHGWICASSDAFGRTPSPDDPGAASTFMDAVRAQANVDGSRPAVAGYGYAADAACRLALASNLFAGAILEFPRTEQWRELGAFAKTDTSFFLFTRKEDPGRDALLTMKDEMDHKGINVTYDELDGKREPMEREEMDPAFAWLDALQR